MCYLGDAPGHKEWLQGRVNIVEAARQLLSKKQFLQFLSLRRRYEDVSDAESSRSDETRASGSAKLPVDWEGEDDFSSDAEDEELQGEETTAPNEDNVKYGRDSNGESSDSDSDPDRDSDFGSDSEQEDGSEDEESYSGDED